MSAAYDKLPPKRRAFVDAFIACGDAREAYRQAGYSAKASLTAAYRMRDTPQVALAIQELRAPAIEARKAQIIERERDAVGKFTKEWVLKSLAIEAECSRNSAAERIAALNVMAKIQGYIVTKPPVQINNVQINVDASQRGVL